jgi:hypothetical protein
MCIWFWLWQNSENIQTFEKQAVAEAETILSAKTLEKIYVTFVENIFADPGSFTNCNTKVFRTIFNYVSSFVCVPKNRTHILTGKFIRNCRRNLKCGSAQLSLSYDSLNITLSFIISDK